MIVQADLNCGLPGGSAVIARDLSQLTIPSGTAAPAQPHPTLAGLSAGSNARNGVENLLPSVTWRCAR